MPILDALPVRLAIAVGIGLLIGAERERHKGAGSDRAAAGIRTFALAALSGGVALALGGEAVFAVTLLVVGGFAALGYVRGAGDDPGLTTEIALVLTALLGALATREPALASGLAVAVAVLLAARTRLHAFVKSALTEQELNDALLFGAAALVVLPLTPDHPIGPYGVLNLRTLWRLVVLVMALSAAGYMALRALGPRFGLPLAGFASGFVSSAATIGSMGARARHEPGLLRAAAAGAALSTVATIAQMALILVTTSPATFARLRTSLAFAAGAAIVYGALLSLRAARGSAGGEAPSSAGRAFHPKAAVLFAGTVTAVLLVSAALQRSLGGAGLLAASALAGFADTHAPAISVASLVAAAKLDAPAAALPILAAMTTNTVTKGVLAALSGGGRFALQVVPGLLLVIAAAWAGTLVQP